MSISKQFSSVLGIFLFLMISIAGYFAISDLAGTQSQRHQQSVSPIFGLIESELGEPLNIAKTLNKIGVYQKFFDAQEPDQAELVALLNDYNEKFDLEFYVAHDKSRKQFNSDGRVFDLIEGEVIWYFALKNETDSDVQAVLGKREDVHLYIDVRQYDAQGNFIGFVGIGKSLNAFITSFNKFKAQYGHEFLFVNNRNEIVLSSNEALLPKESVTSSSAIGIKMLDNLPWYAEFEDQTQGAIEPSLVLESDEGDLLISKLTIESLNWSLYLITPLSERQKEVNQSFAIYIGIGMILLIILYQVLYKLIDHYADRMNRKLNYDPLTKLANRHYAKLFFARARRHEREMGLFMIELDHFEQVKDTHGHHAGDIVLQAVAELLLDSLSPSYLAVRWSDQKFAVLAPSTEEADLQEIAEQLRTKIEELGITYNSSFLHLTASIGINYSRDLSDKMPNMVERAEQAMLKAIRAGRNKVRNYTALS